MKNKTAVPSAAAANRRVRNFMRRPFGSSTPRKSRLRGITEPRSHVPVYRPLQMLHRAERFAARELYGSVGRGPTLRRGGGELGGEAGHRISEFREAVR